MSYLEMKAAPIDDAQQMIISFWFRDTSKQQEHPPPSFQWPQGFWSMSEPTLGANPRTMVPPNAQYSIGYDPAYHDCVFYWNAYGLPLGSGVGAAIFGDAFLGAACCWIPTGPPMVTNTWSGKLGGVADVDMSPYGIRTLLTFGDPDIPYMYNKWKDDDPGVIDSVKYLPNLGFIYSIHPPPYANYYTNANDNGGLFKVRNFRLDGGPQKRDDIRVPQSFIGIDADGHLLINLQTKDEATYRGMAFELTTIKEMWASQTHLEVPFPYTYTEIGFPFPDGYWVSVPGYWNGYEFDYTDISQQVMGCTPESFVIRSASVGLFDFAMNAPVINDGGWHHVLFSFDISGDVHTQIPSVVDPETGATSAGTQVYSGKGCKAWLAVDDRNVTGKDLQNRPPCHDGFLLLPKLRGTETTQILDYGPCTTYSRGGPGDTPNTILPRNAWLHGFFGNPKDNLPRFAANVPLVGDGSDPNDLATIWAISPGGQSPGDYSAYTWTGAIWPLYGHGVAPGPWYGSCDPPRPTTKDPKTFDPPTYDCPGFTIPIRGHPIGVPCGSHNEPENTGVEMAELQIWVGRSLDTGDVNMRRLFIDWPKDKNGNPDHSKPLKTVKPSVASKVLGRPDVLLHGSSNWKNGRNTGKSGEDPDGAGMFEPKSKIEKFVPDPELNK